MRIIVTGGRDYTDGMTVVDAFATIAENAGNEPITLVHGNAPGADRLAASRAAVLGWTIEAHPADWSTYGKSAGPIRNQQMADSGADLLVAFPGGRGTADMIGRALTAGIRVHRVGKHPLPKRKNP